MNKRGFTLIELIGSIVILALIALVAFPAIMNMLDSGQTSVDEKTKQIIISAAGEYVSDNQDTFPKPTSGTKSYTISVQTIYSEGYVSENIYDNLSNGENAIIKVKATSKKYSYEFEEKTE